MAKEVFISYSHEDEAVVGELRAAFEEAGLGVWTDHDGLPAGADWRQGISTALAEAKVVVVAWTRNSVASRWVMEEAHEGQKQRKLIAALLDDAELPVGFAFDHVVQMRGWRRQRGDRRLIDLLEAVSARVRGEAAPTPQAALDRAKRRARWLRRAGMAGFVAMAVFIAFAAQDPICGWSRWPTLVSDACGALDLGHRPTREERLAWKHRPPGCAALQEHLDRFPNGAFRVEAQAQLDAKDDLPPAWVPATLRQELVLEEPQAPHRDEAEARALALGAARAKAERRCRLLGIDDGTFRFQEANFQPRSWQCQRGADGVRCAVAGEAICDLQRLAKREVRRCES